MLVRKQCTCSRTPLSSPEAKKTFTRSSRPSPARATPRRLPGAVVGLAQRLRQFAAGIAEVLFDGRDDLDGTVGEVADHLPQSEADQLADERHGALPPGGKGSFHEW